MNNKKYNEMTASELEALLEQKQKIDDKNELNALKKKQREDNKDIRDALIKKKRQEKAELTKNVGEEFIKAFSENSDKEMSFEDYKSEIETYQLAKKVGDAFIHKFNGEIQTFEVYKKWIDDFVDCWNIHHTQDNSKSGA